MPWLMRDMRRTRPHCRDLRRMDRTVLRKSGAAPFHGCLLLLGSVRSSPLIVLVGWALLSLVPALGDEVLPSPPYPPAAWSRGDWGKLTVHVTFGADGHANRCEVVDCTISPQLADSTIDFITKHWRSAQNAGRVVTVPILFVRPGWHVPRPGYPAKAMREGIQGSFVLRVTFDDKGRAVKCDVLPTSASDLLVKPVCAFILAQWVFPVCAGKTESVPFDFRLR
jgi:hypothetical protein